MPENKVESCQTEIEKQIQKNKMMPIQFYVTDSDKKRLKMYCAANDIKMTDVLNDILNEFLKSKGF